MAHLVRRSVLLFIVLILASAPSLSCRRSTESHVPGILHLRLSSDPSTLDPALITDVTGGLIAAKLFNGLVRFNDDLDIVPDIADRWEISADRRTYTFHLRKGFTFSNGRTVTAEDFRYSFERVLDPATKAPQTWVLDRIEGAGAVLAGKAEHASGINVIDSRTLVIRLEKPFAPFLSLLGMTTAYVVPREEAVRLGRDFGSSASGSGPFVLRKWEHGLTLALSSRPDYAEGAPRLREIVYRVIPEDLTAVVEFETGGLDVLQIPASEYRRFTTDPRWKNLVHGRTGLNCYYLGLNCSRPPFSDVRVRRAMNRAVDRKRILNTIYEKRGTLAAGPVPPALWKYGEGPKISDPYPFDPAAASRTVREAGWAGKTVSMYISSEPEILDMAEVVKQYLDAAGLSVQIVQLDWSAFKQAVNSGKPDIFWLSWWADYPDPEDFLFPLFHSSNAGPAGNRTRFVDPVFDGLIDRAQQTIAPRQRYRLYRQAEDRIIEEAPWVFLWHRSDFSVVQPWVRDFSLHPIYSIDKGMDLSVQ
ncbi:MAG: ABC transporter substrate-binding protein [Nitrospiraceae bacterium]|nr:ABC transporter substrate-binding protein [Nitrospiraceae bacterium]